MSNNTLSCDFCGEENQYAPIIERPSRFGFKGKIHIIPQLNHDGRTIDNTCLECLSEQIAMIERN